MPLPPHLLRASQMGEFTHKGWFMGFVPVYVGGFDTGMMAMSTRNWIPEILMDFAEALFGTYVFLASMFTDELPGYPVLITGELHAGTG